MEVALSLPSAFCLWFWSHYSLQSGRAWLETTDFHLVLPWAREHVPYCTVQYFDSRVSMIFCGHLKVLKVLQGGKPVGFVLERACRHLWCTSILANAVGCAMGLCYEFACLQSISWMHLVCGLHSLGWAWCGWVCCRNGTLFGALERVTQGMMC